MNIKTRFWVLSLLLLVATSNLIAVPAYPGKIVRTQPDGSIIEFYLRGDEFFSYAITTDGYLITENEQGVMCYAELHNNMLVATAVKASLPANRTSEERAFLISAQKEEKIFNRLNQQAAQNRARAAANVPPKAKYPLNGSPRSLVLLVNYTDCKFTSPTAQQDFTKLLNESGHSSNGGSGSARDYFIASSDSIFRPQFDVYGPFDLPRPVASYGAHSGGSNDCDAYQMVVDACGAAYNNGVDFKLYDTNNDGALDNVFVYYAGYNEAEGGGPNTIWPHRSSLSWMNVSYDGITVRDYACSSEFRSNGGQQMCGIGTFCHEFGHVLGLPDLYVTDYSSSHPVPGAWDVMCNGSYNNSGFCPPTYSSYARFSLGWLTPEQLSGGIYTLEPLITTNQAYLYADGEHNLRGNAPSPYEFWMLENRQPIGMDEKSLPGVGMLITHVVYNASSWMSNTPNNDPNNVGVQIDGANGLSNYASGYDTYPGALHVTEHYFVKRDGTRMPDPIIDITENNGLISFKHIGGNEYPLVEQVSKLATFDIIFGATPDTQTVSFVCSRLVEDLQLRIINSDNFRIRQNGTNGNFSKSLTLSPEADSTLNFSLDVLFAPQYMGYSTPLTGTLEITSKYCNIRVPLQGYSRRAVYITTPIALPATNITSSSFKANWHPVDDASFYYVSAYSESEGEGEEVEAFTNFDKETPLGWQSTFNTTSTLYRQSQPCSAQFSEPGDTLWSKKYSQAVIRLSFWLYAANTNGTFYVEARSNDGTWNIIKTVKIDATVRGNIIKIELDEDDDIREFKFYYHNNNDRGLVAFDDCTATFSRLLTYYAENQKVNDTTLLVSGVPANTRVLYNLRATDITYNGATLLYENITDYSNTIEVETLAGELANNILNVALSDDGTQYVVYLDGIEAPSGTLLIYSVDGKLISSITVNSNEIEVPPLKNGQLYILKFTPTGKIKRGDKFAKLFYEL